MSGAASRALRSERPADFCYGSGGLVVPIVDWMLDPVICAGMSMGAPRLERAALIELKRLLIGAADTTYS